MRIAHLACVAPPEIGGIGRVAAEEVRALRAAREEAILFAPQGEDHVPDDESIRRLRPRWRLGNAASLPRGPVETWRPDVLHLHYPFYGTAEAWLFRKPTYPLVVTFHMDATPTGWRGNVVSFHQRFLQPFLLRNVDACLVSSRDYAEHSSLASGLVSLGPRLHEVPFAVDTERFSPRPHVASMPAQLLFVGGMDAAHHFKGVPELLQALAGLKEASWQLTLIGDGALRPRYEEEARSLGLGTRAVFRGRISDDELVSAYQSADLLLFPSTSGAEAFGLVALEAQACGVPVIASNLPGVRTVVRHGETGLLVSPGDISALREAILSLLRDPRRRQVLGHAARTHVVARYSWPVHVLSLQRIYRKVCASRS